MLIYDKNNEIVPATDGSTSNLVAENKHFVGNAIPKVILSWDHTFKYKNWICRSSCAAGSGTMSSAR